MLIPGGALELTAVAPVQARANSGIEYRILVRNISDNLVLHDIVLAEAESGTTTIESVRIDGERPAGAQDRGRNQNADAGNADTGGQGDQAIRAGRSGQGQNQQSQNRGNDQSMTSTQGKWTIKQLGPGQSKTLVINASASKEGQAMTCLVVESYKPALCLMTEIVKPEIQITKTAPEEALLCVPFEIQYVITNPGTGDIDAFTLRDPLPEGLRLIDEKEEIAYRIDGLRAGDSRSFVARVIADRPGDYRSRAEAVAGENLRARSENTGTRIRAADLAIQLEGPSQTYVNRNMTYTAYVHNAGDAPALDATLMIQIPQEDFRVVDMGAVRVSDRDFRVSMQDQGSPNLAEPLPAEAAVERNRNAIDDRDEPQLQPVQTLELGDLAPGETRQFSFVVRATQPDTYPIVAATDYLCGEIQDDRPEAVAQTEVEVLSLAALAIGVADEQDPVPVGKQVSYLVSVVNEGTASDQNVRVTATLPQNLQFVEGSGQSEVTAEGQNLTFATVNDLEPGEAAEWRVVLEAKQPGNIQFEIQVQSDKSSGSVAAAEPTTLFQER